MTTSPAMGSPNGSERKPATAARIYDYYLGGTYNFEADREAARAMTAMFPYIPAAAQANRAFLRRAVRHLTGLGVDQFLDIGSGLPTEGNVHEVAPDARVVYVDIDPDAVSESLEILGANDKVTAIRGDLREVPAILAHPQVRRLLDFDRPIGVLLLAVLHFLTDDDQADASVRRLVGAMAPGSHLVISHATNDFEADIVRATEDKLDTARDIYNRQTATPLRLRGRSEISELFRGLEMVEPGLVWLPQWRPEPGDPQDFATEPYKSGFFVAVGQVPTG